MQFVARWRMAVQSVANGIMLGKAPQSRNSHYGANRHEWHVESCPMSGNAQEHAESRARTSVCHERKVEKARQ